MRYALGANSSKISAERRAGRRQGRGLMARIPDHIGIIPDGNRRWAQNRGLSKEEGYQAGLLPGKALFKLCEDAGVKELTFYGFTQDNTKRNRAQRLAFTKACIEAVSWVSGEDADLLIVGKTDTPMFPEALIPYTRERTRFGSGGIRINFLVNYGWLWDLSGAGNNGDGAGGGRENANSSGDPDDSRDLSSREDLPLTKRIRSSDISRIDLIIRWGGRRRLSGFLPVQSVYSDFYIVDDLWPDFRQEHLEQALQWYRGQDVTLGG